MKRPYLSVVIPAYKEVVNLRKGILREVEAYLKKQSYTWEVLVVDDGSPDETAMMAKRFSKERDGFRVMEEPHRGKGGTVIAGMLAARGERVLFTDMDQATPLSELEKLLPKFEEGYDVVMGSRAGREGAPIIRKLMAWGFAVLRIVILRLPYKDTQCGFKIFRNESAKKIFEKMKNYNEKVRVRGASVSAGFDIEVLYIARKMGLKVAEVPVVWHHQETKRVSAIKDSWQGLRDLVKVRINALLGKYK